MTSLAGKTIALLYAGSLVLTVPCFVCGRLANLHCPEAGVDLRLAWASLIFGLAANLLGIGAMVYVFVNAVGFRG